MIGRKKITRMGCLFVIGLLGLCSCGSPSSDSEPVLGTEVETTEYTVQEEASTEEITELVYERSVDLEYAENFSVDYYKGGYTLLTTTMDGKKFLVVPEGMSVPEGLDEDVAVLQRPIANLYLVASSIMDMFCELDGLDSITLSGQKEEGWYIEGAKEAMANGDIVYAGKYNKPDYELIVSANCSLAIENMMISHSPEVIEKLEDFGIPVMIEYSSYESHPLGRVEWIKFFGALLGKEEEAERIFDEQVEILEQVEGEIHGFCSGIGTGGTLSGIGHALKAKYPEMTIWAVEPDAAAILSGGLIGTHVQMGIGDGMIPAILNTEIYDDICIITDEEALSTAKMLAKKEGIMCGISSGTNVAAAIKMAKKLGAGKTVFVVLPDTAERYFSTPLFDNNY